MDNIIIKKIWTDVDFFQIEISFVTPMLNCRVVTYSNEEEIKNLSSEFLRFSSNQEHKMNWEIGERGSDHSPKICIQSSSNDNKGHVFLNIFCDVLSPLESNEYFCQFPLLTELGLIREFSFNLLKIINATIGETIDLLGNN